MQFRNCSKGLYLCGNPENSWKAAKKLLTSSEQKPVNVHLHDQEKMKIKFNFISERKKEIYREQETYKVIMYRLNSDNVIEAVWFANDLLDIIQPGLQDLSIVDNDVADYLMVKNNLYALKTFEPFFRRLEASKMPHDFADDEDLWQKSKLSPFFTKNNFIIPEHYKNTILNKAYKTNLVEGFLRCTCIAINNDSYEEHYEEFTFITISNLNNLFDPRYFKNIQQVQLKTIDYPEILLNFIGNELFLIKDLSFLYENLKVELAKLIDSIFINDIESIQIRSASNNKMLIIEYENEFFCLNKFSS